MSLAVGFAGTPAFAAVALEAILAAGHRVELVLTRPDKPKGRGLKLEASPVKALALARGLAVLQPATLRSAEARAALFAIPLDVLVVAAYGLILPPEVLGWPRHGCLNIHASRLPRWRGAAPIQRALLAGDEASGVTIMRMDEGLDTGPIVRIVDLPIGPHDTAGSLHDKLAHAGAEAIVEVLGRLASGERLPATPQPAQGATYAPKIDRAEAAIDWTREAVEIDRQVRAFDPAPGAFARWDETPIKIWRALALPAGAEHASAGMVIRASASGLDVACGAGVLRIDEVQPAGSRRMSVRDFLAGHRIEPGMGFEPGLQAPTSDGAS